MKQEHIKWERIDTLKPNKVQSPESWGVFKA